MLLWWLRTSSDSNQTYAYGVYHDGSLFPVNIDRKINAVRPVIVVDLSLAGIE